MLKTRVYTDNQNTNWFVATLSTRGKTTYQICSSNDVELEGEVQGNARRAFDAARKRIARRTTLV